LNTPDRAVGSAVDHPPGHTSIISSLAARSCVWSERWIPDPFAIVTVVAIVVAIFAAVNGAAPMEVARSFGNGFWSLIPFTMQMAFIVIGGYVTAESAPVAKVIRNVAKWPANGRQAVLLIAFSSMALSLIHWGLSIVVASLLAREIARRTDIRTDYRAAGAAAYLGLGSVWALGLSSSAAQLQANPASMPKALLAVTGVIPFDQTIFLWQSLLLAAVLIAVSSWTAWATAPRDDEVRTAHDLGVDIHDAGPSEYPVSTRPGEWLEFSPAITVCIAALALTWLIDELRRNGLLLTISSLNNYNFIFLMLGLALHWRPRRFLDSAARSVKGVTGILIQFPLLGAIAMLLTGAKNESGEALADILSRFFTEYVGGPAFAILVSIYSAILGVLIPSGGGKWVIEAPYVMTAANAVQYHLGWVVQIYNAAEALPNLINPFWMLPVLGILGLKARDLIGFTFVQFLVNFPIVLFLLWLLGTTLEYQPPVMPTP
jgi:short-chain fatty acids transporter